MQEYLKLDNFNFSYNDKKLFDNFSIKITEGSFNVVMGNSSMGLSTLSKVLSGVIINDYDLTIDKKKVNEDNISKIRKEVHYIGENPNNLFVCNSVEEDMYFYLRNKGLSNISIKSKIDALITNSDLKELLALPHGCLSGGEKQLIAVLLEIMCEPKLLIIDNTMSMLSNDIKKEIFGLLKELNEENKCTIIYFTHDSEDLLMGTDVVILKDGIILLQEKIEDAFNDIKLFTTNKIKLPFIIELSDKLKYYNIIDKLYYDEDELVNDLWK